MQTTGKCRKHPHQLKHGGGSVMALSMYAWLELSHFSLLIMSLLMAAAG